MLVISLLVFCSQLLVQVRGHGAVVFPPPRNNIDHGEAPWDAEVPFPVPAVSDPRNGIWCPIPNPFFNNTLTGSESGFYNTHTYTYPRSQWPSLFLVF